VRVSFLLHDHAYYPILYRVEIMLHGEVAAEIWALQPFAAFAAGDLFNPRGAFTTRWPALSDLVHRGMILRIEQVEHLLSGMGGTDLMHDTQLWCVEVPDTYATRQPPQPWARHVPPDELEDAC
jgi:hypothetical protein